MTPTTREILRSIEEKIAALESARTALQAAFSDEAPPAAKPKIGPGKTAHGPASMTLPQALEQVLTAEWRSPSEITEAIHQAGLKVGAKVSAATVRTALSRLHKKMAWARKALAGGYVKYRKGSTKPEEVTEAVK